MDNGIISIEIFGDIYDVFQIKILLTWTINILIGIRVNMCEAILIWDGIHTPLWVQTHSIHINI